MNYIRICFAIFSMVVLAGCATSAGKMNGLSVGITKQEAIRIMGKPKSTSASQGVEYLIYVLDASKVDLLPPTDYYVRLSDGKVDSYGRVRDLPGR